MMCIAARARHTEDPELVGYCSRSVSEGIRRSVELSLGWQHMPESSVLIHTWQKPGKVHPTVLMFEGIKVNSMPGYNRD
jgi:hypothetical protein